MPPRESLKPTAEAEIIFKKWIAHLNDEFTKHGGYERRSDIVRDELHQIYLGKPHGGRLNSTLVTELPTNTLIESLDPRNVTLEAEYLSDVDSVRYYERKPLIYFWQMFDHSALGLNHWLGTRFRCMLAHHIFAAAGKGLQIARGVEVTFGYNITAEDNVTIPRHVLIDDRQAVTLKQGTEISRFFENGRLSRPVWPEDAVCTSLGTRFERIHPVTIDPARMNLEATLIIFEFVVLVFAFCMHEAAHAWMANRLGDPTARMLGRITLNPVKHIDPVGSIIMPLMAMFYHLPLIGWAKPTPVTARNFKNYKRDDILVTLAGPASNLIAATVSLLLLIIIKHAGKAGALSVYTAVAVAFRIPEVGTEGLPTLFPIALLLYFGVLINLSLFVFNLIPLPPLDGSHVLRHFLPHSMLNAYDRIGMFSIFILMFLGGRLISIGLDPLLAGFNSMLMSL